MAKPKYPAGTEWRCLRCKKRWRSRLPSDTPPRACAGCKSAYWDKPPQAIPHASQGAR